jgi:hypothetical protein
MARPKEGEYNPYAKNYVALTTGDDVLKELEASVVPLQNFFGGMLDEKKGSHSYAPGKWTVKQLIQHMIDAERVFAYRAMCIARGEQQPLPSFEENDYANNATAENRTLQGLISELMLMRQASLTLFRHFSTTELERTGITSGYPSTVNAIGFIIVGHAIHHMNILQKRYL